MAVAVPPGLVMVMVPVSLGHPSAEVVVIWVVLLIVKLGVKVP